MAAEYTGITLTAGQGLLTNQGIRTPPQFLLQLAEYRNIDIVDEYRRVLANASTVLNANTLAQLGLLGSNTFAALTDTIPNNSLANVTFDVNGLSGYVETRAENLIGNIAGNLDLSKFAQIIFASNAFISQSTAYINAAYNSGLYQPALTYPGANALITGNFATVSNDLQNFSQDLSLIGYAINFADLANFGSPVVLINTLYRLNGLLPCVINAMVQAGIDYNLVYTIAGAGVATVEQNACIYVALSTITAQDLAQVKKVLRCTTAGINTGADLLDVAKLFPNSFLSFSIKIGTESYKIYTNATTLNSQLPYLGDRLRLQQPYTQGQAAIAFAQSLAQIKGIETQSASTLSSVLSGLETLDDLPLISAFTEYVPASVQNYYVDIFAQGTGVNNTFTAFDLLGTAVGSPEQTAYANISGDILTIPQQEFVALSNTYSAMQTVLSTTPANANVIFSTVLIPQATAEINQLALSYANLANTTQANCLQITAQLQRENEFLYAADVDFNTLSDTSLNSTLGLITNLHQLALDSSARGYSNLLTQLADTDSLFGQAIVASQREGRNIVELDSAGIQLDAGLDPTPVQ